MDRIQMKSSLDRVFVLQYFKAEEIGPYSEAIFESCGWMDAYRFEAAVKEVVKTLKTNVRLKPAHFIGAYKQLAEDNGWARKETHVCASCGGPRFVYVWLKDTKGVEFRAMKGCSECNPKYSNVHPNFTEIQAPPAGEFPFPGVKTIPPAMAQCLIGIADSARLNLPEDLLNDLMEAAAQPEARDFGPRGYDPTKRKNELVVALAKALEPPAPEELSEEDLRGIPF